MTQARWRRHAEPLPPRSPNPRLGTLPARGYAALATRDRGSEMCDELHHVLEETRQAAREIEPLLEAVTTDVGTIESALVNGGCDVRAPGLLWRAANAAGADTRWNWPDSDSWLIDEGAGYSPPTANEILPYSLLSVHAKAVGAEADRRERPDPLRDASSIAPL